MPACFDVKTSIFLRINGSISMVFWMSKGAFGDTEALGIQNQCLELSKQNVLFFCKKTHFSINSKDFKGF